MNFLHRLRQHLNLRPLPSAAAGERLQTTEQELDTDTGLVALDEIERLDGSGASLETLLEMNRVQGW